VLVLVLVLVLDSVPDSVPVAASALMPAAVSVPSGPRGSRGRPMTPSP
jgi:hypothetical protein